MTQFFDNSIIAQRFLSKSKKYYRSSQKIKNKENTLTEDISSIVAKLKDQPLPKISHPIKHKSAFFSQRSRPKPLLAVNNSMNFFSKNDQCMMERKGLQRELYHFIKRMKQPIKQKKSLYQEYIGLWQETNDYLEYYLINYAGEQSGRASELLKQQGKTVILLVLKKHYKCFQVDYNPSDIVHRIMLAFGLNALNDFQFVSWQKFMKIKKMISGEFNKRDCVQFLLSYFFSSHTKELTGTEFWSIFNSSIRKIGTVTDNYSLDNLLKKVNDEGNKMIPETAKITKDKFKQIIYDNPMYLWQEFVLLTFI